MHKNTQMHINAYKHAHTHTHEHIHKHTRRNTYAHVHEHTHMHTNAHTHANKHTQAHIRIHIHTCTQIHTHAHKCTHTCSQTQTQACTQGHTCIYRLLSLTFVNGCANNRRVINSEKVVTFIFRDVHFTGHCDNYLFRFRSGLRINISNPIASDEDFHLVCIQRENRFDFICDTSISSVSALQSPVKGRVYRRQ